MLKLQKLKLDNFRGYKNIEIDLNDTLNVIIGRNDIGKSTILEIFFNNDKIKVEVDDLHIHAENKKMSISCCFRVEDDKVLIDATNYIPVKMNFS